MRKGDYLKLSDYIINENGQIINKKNGHVLKGQPNGKGYLRVSIGGRLYFIHRLVAEKYIPNPDGKPQVNHIDGDKTNNAASNLEWATNKENRIHALKNGLHLKGEQCPWSKLTPDDVQYIRNHKDRSNTVLANQFNVSRSTIRAVKNNLSWKND